MHESLPRICPRCGTEIPESSVHGLCPSCVFARVMQPTVEGASAPPQPPDLEAVRAAFPHLEVLRLVGSGGMGAVYLARQPQLDRLVALKILPSVLADRPGFSERFQHEARALAKLSHPHIVTVHDYGQEGGFYYLLMEYVDGLNLRQLLQAKRLSPKEALSIVSPVCDALQCAHDHGIVHRDIKPENLLIDRTGVVKIADFGIAKMVGRGEGPTSPADSGSAPEGAAVSLPLGTPDYAAPEQADGNADHRADIYSLGVVLYEMLTGERPRGPIEAPSRRVQVDIRIDEIVLRALAREPELRFATAAEFRTEAEALVRNTEPGSGSSEWTAPPTGWAWFIGRIFGTSFRSRSSWRMANLSALGFLAFLGFVPLPGWENFFGFAAFFGLVGLAFLVEALRREEGSRRTGRGWIPVTVFVGAMLLTGWTLRHYRIAAAERQHAELQERHHAALEGAFRDLSAKAGAVPGLDPAGPAGETGNRASTPFKGPGISPEPFLQTYAVDHAISESGDAAVWLEGFRALVDHTLRQANPRDPNQPSYNLNAASKRLVVLATLEQHMMVAKILASMKFEPLTDSGMLRRYPLEFSREGTSASLPYAELRNLLQEIDRLGGRTKSSVAVEDRSLLIRADADQHRAIETLIEAARKRAGSPSTGSPSTGNPSAGNPSAVEQ